MKRNHPSTIVTLIALAIFAGINHVAAQNTLFTYQGRVTDNGTNFTGTGQFKFALVTSTNYNHQATATAVDSSGFITSYNITAGGNGYTTAPAITISGGGGSGAAAHTTITGGVVTLITVDNPGSGYTSTPTVTIAPPAANITYATFWSNDGTSVAGSAPTSAVSAGVTNGLFTAVLGDTTLANMTAIDASLFTQPNLQLRIWFNDGVNGFAALSPIQNLTPTPYADFATTANGVSGTLQASQITGIITSANISGTYGSAVTLNNANNSFSGNGAGLTSVNAATLNGVSAFGFWEATGNSGTTPAVNFVGTADNQPLELHVNGVRALRLEPNANGVPNVIGGSQSNFVATGTTGAFVGGGGSTNYLGANSVSSDYSTVAGGYGNTIQAGSGSSTIAGGSANNIQGSSGGATIGGGSVNSVQSFASTIAGGYQNTIQAKGNYSFIGGGQFNTIQAEGGYFFHGSVIGGGYQCMIQSNADVSVIGGGEQNVIQTNANHSFIGGGQLNTVQAGSWLSFIGCGDGNTIMPGCVRSFIGGGSDNIMQASRSVVGGGGYNTVSGSDSVVPGGYGNTASGDDSFAAGMGANAVNPDCFVWSDGGTTTSTAARQFMVRAGGGIIFYSAGPGNTAGVSLAAGSGTWSSLSDQNSKDNFLPVDTKTVLEKVAAMPLTTWNYKTQDQSIRHIGPMAQDFYAAFSIGEDNKHITTIDSEGVALAAIKGLNQKVDEQMKAKDAAIQQLQETVAQLKDLVNKLAANQK